MLTTWINQINTTSLRIATSLVLALAGVPAVLFALLFFAWEPSALQLKVLIGLAGFVLTMMGFDVLQFVGKRFSDAEYQRAKNPSPVTAEGPSTVNVVTEAAPRVAPASEGVGAPAAPAPPVVPDLTRIPAPEQGP